MAHTVQTPHSMLQSTFPVLLPDMPQLKLSNHDFAAYIRTLSAAHVDAAADPANGVSTHEADSKQSPSASTPPPTSAFMDALSSDKHVLPSFDEHDGKMLTENLDVAYSNSASSLVNLFYELEDVVAAHTLRELLEKAWADDAGATLKIIWNARSIHLGKSSRKAFYKALGWLYENHPVTLLSNLQWLVRPVIQKKAPKKDDKSPDKDGPAVHVDAKDAESDFEMVDEDNEASRLAADKKRELSERESADAEFDVKYGVAHGYWKDLLNILALAAHDELKVSGSSAGILNTEKPNEKKCKRDWTSGRKKRLNQTRYEAVLDRLDTDPKYKALHLTVARLFAGQVQLDLARLESNDKEEIKKVTLAGKWAPSSKGMHDQHTTIVTSIAELLHPFNTVCPDADPADRESYIKHARNAYQVKTLSKLRKQLQIVERNLTAETFDQIQYDRIPSLAMKQYTPLFARKDFDNFDKYIENVAQGKAKISGAVLLPSTLVKELYTLSYPTFNSAEKQDTNTLVAAKIRQIARKSINGQWNTLVQRIKDSGTLSSSIAVCDVSGSMQSPVFPDGTAPLHSAIGLSLLIAEATAPPFGGAFISFHSRPQILRVGGPEDKRSFAEKVAYISRAPWAMNTDFVAVFEKLILPMAVEQGLKPEEMVQRVFVFSDMQFDAARREYHGDPEDRWTTSYERVQAAFKEHGYEMPQLVFWNLAGGRAGYDVGPRALVVGDDATAPKPVTAAEEGTALVSGYSQGQLKMFLDDGVFGDEADGEDDEEMVEMNGEGDVVEKVKKRDNPLATLQKAIGHEAYRMLKVVD